MSGFSGGPLTEEEEYLIEKYKILREKKKLLQKVLKEKAETKAKPAVKRELVPTASSATPEDAKRKAEMLVASGCVKIQKSSGSRDFKRARTSEKKKDVLSDQESIEKKQEQSDAAIAMKEMYSKNFVKSKENSDHDNYDSNPNYREYNYNRGNREPKKGNTIFIKGYGLTEEIVRNEFNKYGTVTDVHFERDRRFGFVTYQSVDEAEKTIREMNGTKVANVYVQVCYARRQFHNDRSDGPMWSRDLPQKPREWHDKDSRELQRYGDADEFF